jgi:hypothetical protein
MPAAYDYVASTGDQTSSGLTRDVSPYGIGFFSDRAFEPADKLELKIHIPDVNINIDARGEVIYCIANPGESGPGSKYLVGARFTEGPLEDFSLADSRQAKSRHTPSHTLTIRADAGGCFDLLSDFDRYPEWASGVEEAKVLETYPDGRGKRVEFLHNFFLRKVRYELYYYYDDENKVLSWVSGGGDEEIVGISGSYSFQSRGPDMTFATYKLEVTLSIIPSKRIVQYVTKVLMRKEMKNFRAFAEKNE